MTNINNLQKKNMNIENANNVLIFTWNNFECLLKEEFLPIVSMEWMRAQIYINWRDIDGEIIIFIQNDQVKRKYFSKKLFTKKWYVK